MISLGRQKAKIVSAFIGANDNGNPYVGIRLQPIDGEEVCTTKVYLTAKALGFAARKLAACGFDIKVMPLERIEENSDIMNGHEVEIDVTEETYNGRNFQKVEIVVPLPTVEKSKLAVLTAGMRDAIKKDAEKPAAKTAAKTPKGPGAAVAHIPPEEQARLNKQAEEDGVGF